MNNKKIIYTLIFAVSIMAAFFIGTNFGQHKANQKNSAQIEQLKSELATKNQVDRDVKTETISHLYPLSTIVTKLDKENDLVIVTDANGNEWSFNGIEDTLLNDICSLIMYDNNTPEIYDDEIVDVRCAWFSEMETKVDYHLYPLAGIITDVDEESNTFTITDGNDMNWELKGIADNEVGDVCTMIMSDNNTFWLDDDEIIDIRIDCLDLE